MNNTYFEKVNSYDNREKHYFASCNTPKGFVSFFRDIFNPESFEKVYILKGGPGVGKSTLLKTIAKEAAMRNMDVEYFHCSSSPLSLDGIIINDLKIAMFDGTPPHDIEPTYPGIREVIINMGECWNIEKLQKQRDEVSALIKKKASLYKKATNYLNASHSIKSEMFDAIRTTVNMEKLNESVKRVYKAQLSKCPKTTDRQSSDIRITSAYCNRGKVHLETFAKLSEVCYFVKDVHRTAFIYFEQLYKQVKDTDIKTIVSYSPENPKHIDGLYFPDKKLCFVTLTPHITDAFDKAAKTYKIINMGRFVDSQKTKDKKQSLKFGEKCISELESAAFEALAQAAKTHDDIEAIYIPATNYKCVTKLTASICKELFKK